MEIVVSVNDFMQKTITILKQEYDSLKRKASFADDALLQLENSLRDAQSGRVREARH